MPARCVAKWTEDVQNALKKSKLVERETHLREKKEEKADSSGKNRPRNDMFSCFLAAECMRRKP